MCTTLLRQYELVVDSREAVFNYLETLSPADVIKSVPAFNNKSIGSIFIHSADTYILWLVNFARQERHPYFTEEDYKDVDAIRAAFGQVNSVVNDFLNYFNDDLNKLMTLTQREEGIQLTLSPLHLFTHVITHEFHHKGQIANMSRQLEYIPVDTDIIRF